MPLTNSVPYNIEHLIRKWKRTGKIGASSPSTMAEAKKQAAAIAYEHQRGGHSASLGIEEYADKHYGKSGNGKKMGSMSTCMSLDGMSDANIEEADSVTK